MSQFRPMLAATYERQPLKYPLRLSPKLDGIRCLIINGMAMSRSLKPIPNQWVQDLFGHSLLNGLDGELVVGPPNAPDVYSRTSSGVMSVGGQPDVKFYVFDDFTDKNVSFELRYASVLNRVGDGFHLGVELVPQLRIDNEEQLDLHEQDFVGQGYEGVMLRQPSSPYKWGRATAREAYLLKVKRFEDGEAEVLNVIERRKNTNEALRNELGYLERSSKKVGLIGAGTMGALVCRDLVTNMVFELGSGFTAKQRAEWWLLHRKGKAMGAIVKYKHQPAGAKDTRRLPIFLGIRDRRDM